MFQHVFTRPRESSPSFNFKDVQFRLTLAQGLLSVECLCKSIESKKYKVDLKVHFSDDGDDAGKNKKFCGDLSRKHYNFVYSFSMIHNYFSIPVEGPLEKAEILIEEDSSDKNFTGLANLGATCYINSFTQTMYFISAFKEYLYSKEGYYKLLLSRLFYRMDSVNKSRSENWFKSAETECQDFEDALSGYIKNLSFVDSVNTHQDVHEFSKILFDKLENEDKNIKKIIEGALVAKIECGCGCVYTREEPFQDIQLGLRDGYSKISCMEESLKIFCRDEVIEGYKCEKHGNTTATKKLKFKRLPSVLFVLINRFGMDMETGEYSKNNDFFRFSEKLDLSEYMVDESKTNYKLYSVIVHSGFLDEGHFYCYLNLGGRYYKFNDEEVNECIKEEAVEWNFGGMHPFKSKEKTFSAYYLVYMEESVENTVNFSLFDKLSCGSKKTKGDDKFNPSNLLNLKGNKEDGSVKEAYENEGSDSDEENPVDSNLKGDFWDNVVRDRNKCSISTVTSKQIVGYKGLGAYNLEDYSYPQTPHSVITCSEFDNVSKLTRGQYVYDQTFKLAVDVPIVPNSTYLVYNGKKDGKLVIIKIYKQSLWCTFPSSLVTIGAFPIKSLESLNGFVEYEKFTIFRENDRAIIKSFEDINEGDVLILAQSQKELLSFLTDFEAHQIVNVIIGQMTFPIFVKRNLRVDDLQETIQEYFCSRDIQITGKKSEIEIGGDLENHVVTKSAMASDVLDEKNRIYCEAENTNVIYTGIVGSGVDVNLLDHIHVFLVPNSADKNYLLKKFRLSKFICMKILQGNDDLQVVETFKDSLNARILADGQNIVNGGLILIQKKIKNPIKVCFYSGSYQPLNYPFFIENPGTVIALREKYFFMNKIVLFNGASYTECPEEWVVEMSPYEALLIERK